jgi:hypothetical protein
MDCGGRAQRRHRFGCFIIPALRLPCQADSPPPSIDEGKETNRKTVKICTLVPFPDGIDQRPTWCPEGIPLDDGRILVLEYS